MIIPKAVGVVGACACYHLGIQAIMTGAHLYIFQLALLAY